MPDNYGRMTASEMPSGLSAVLFPSCPWRPNSRKVPLFCPRCGLLGAHAGDRAQESDRGKET